MSQGVASAIPLFFYGIVLSDPLRYNPTMRAIILGDIDAVYLAREMEEDEDRRKRGKELVSVEVDRELYEELCKEDGAVLRALKEYVKRRNGNDLS